MTDMNSIEPTSTSEPAVNDHGDAPASTVKTTFVRGQSFTFRRFLEYRNAENTVVIDRYLVNNVSFLFAYLAHRMELSANQVTLLSGVFGILAFPIALVVPAENLPLSILAVFAFAQISYIFDCADGQLARTTNTTSEFGAFLDKSTDALSNIAAFGGLFAVLFRHYAEAGRPEEGMSVLLVGFAFLAVRSARFFAVESFLTYLSRQEDKTGHRHHTIKKFLISLMDHQMSLALMLVALWSIPVALALLVGQTILLLTAYVGYFVRGLRISKL